MNTLSYLFAGYTAVFAGLFLYVRRIARRSAELEEDLRELRDRLGH